MSLRDWIELLLEQGETTVRREAATTLAATPVPMVAEVLGLAVELEGGGEMAGELAELAGSVRGKLAPGTVALSADPVVAAVRSGAGGYWPIGLLARSAETRTYLTVQLGLRRLVSLKILAPRRPASAQERARFLSTYRQLARVLHPHAASILDAGEDGGFAHVAIEMVDGFPLVQVVPTLEEGDWRTPVRLVREAASALSAVHRAGLAHGRISPLTMLVDRERRLKLIEFDPGEASIGRDLEDLGTVFHELLARKVMKRPIDEPLPPLDSDLPAPIAALAERLSFAADSEGFGGAEELIEALDAAVAAVDAERRDAERAALETAAVERALLERDAEHEAAMEAEREAVRRQARETERELVERVENEAAERAARDAAERAAREAELAAAANAEAQAMASALSSAESNEPLAAAAPASPPPRVSPLSGRRVLFVDDEAKILELAQMLLEPTGIQIETSLSPEDALKKIAQGGYDVVVTDLTFPRGLSGIDLVAALRRNKDPIPVVAMSATQDTQLWDDVLREGVSGIVAKPLDTTELVAVIQRAISRRRSALLLVDDSHLARRVFKRFFENRGFAVTVVVGVETAIESIKTSVPDVILSDLHLDDGTGVDILQYVHDNHPEVQMIIMSAKPDADAVIRAHRLDVFDFVNKSEDPRYLLRSVERVVISHRSAVDVAGK